MTRLLYLPDENTLVQLDVKMPPSQLCAAINSGMRPLPLLRNAPAGKLLASEIGNTVVVAPLLKKMPPSKSIHRESGLSRRQIQVHELASRGLSSGEIALLLHLSRRTINYHLNQVKIRMRHQELPQRELFPPATDYSSEE